MNVLRAKPMGLCTGVRRALAIAEGIDCPETVTIDGQLVHNEAVQTRLARRGFRSGDQRDRNRLPETPDVMITAHGVSDRRRRWLQSAGKRLIDTTCPLVCRAHRKAQELQADGYHVLVVGRAEHVEVQGIVEDLASYDVIGGPCDVATYPYDRLGVIFQTTTRPSVAEEICLAIRMRNLRAEIRFEDTICPATRQRQRAVERLLPEVDAMVVVGGRQSNNTRELVDLCRRQGVPVCHVESAAQLDAAWFQDVATVGLSAGTSTDQQAIDEVAQALRRLRVSQSRVAPSGVTPSEVAPSGVACSHDAQRRVSM